MMETGAHRESARAIAQARADIAVIDAVSSELVRAHDDRAAGLKVVGSTAPTPGEPV